MVQQSFNSGNSEGKDSQAKMLRVCVGGGSDVLVIACGGSSLATLKPYQGPSSTKMQYLLTPMEQPGVVIDASRAYVTHPADLANLARWFDEAAEWLADQLGIELYDDDDDDEEYEEYDDEEGDDSEYL